MKSDMLPASSADDIVDSSRSGVVIGRQVGWGLAFGVSISHIQNLCFHEPRATVLFSRVLGALFIAVSSVLSLGARVEMPGVAASPVVLSRAAVVDLKTFGNRPDRHKVGVLMSQDVPGYVPIAHRLHWPGPGPTSIGAATAVN